MSSSPNIQMKTDSSKLKHPVDNIKTAHEVLERNVVHTVQTEVGDPNCLQDQKDLALKLVQAAQTGSFNIDDRCLFLMMDYHQHQAHFNPAEFSTFENNIAALLPYPFW